MSGLEVVRSHVTLDGVWTCRASTNKGQGPSSGVVEPIGDTGRMTRTTLKTETAKDWETTSDRKMQQGASTRAL
eukprot:1280997-Rhodomonas_salina.4